MPSAVALLLLILFVLVASPVLAEPYLQVQGGLALPARLHDFEGEYWSKGRMHVSDLGLQSGLAYGAKAGYFVDALPWLGLEIDYLHATPHDRGQNYWITTPQGSASLTRGAHEPAVHLRIDSVAVNTVVRYPGETWQPYLAAGPAAFVGNYGGDPTNTSLGVNAEAGVRVVIWSGLFVSASYRYQQAHLTFRESSGPGGCINGFTTFYQSQFALGGVGWNF